MFSDLLTVLREYGIAGILAILVLLLGYKFFDKFIDRFFSNSHGDINDYDLRSHKFFVNASYRLVVDVPNLDAVWIAIPPIRKKLFKSLVRIKTETVIDVCKGIVELDLTHMQVDEWVNTVLEKCKFIITDFQNRALLDGIPEIVIQKFSNWNSTTINLLKEYVTTLGSSKMYTNNIARTDTLLIIMEILLITTIADAERSLAELNGEITGLPYKSFIID